MIYFLAALNALGDVVGAALATSVGRGSTAWLGHLTAVAAGLLLTTCLLSLFPEVVEADPNAAVFVLGGYLVMLLAENLFITHVHEPHLPTRERRQAHPLFGDQAEEEPLISRVASGAAVIGLSLHALFDGVAIGAALSLGEATGNVVAVAVFVHKLPEGFGVASIVRAAGATRALALAGGVLLGLLTLAGVGIALVLEREELALTAPLLGFATGTLLYVAATDLVPALNGARRQSGVFLVLLGVVLMFAARALAGMVGLE